MEKTIDTLVEDIYGLFNEDEHHEPNEDNLQELGKNIVELVRRRLARKDDERDPLRFSNLGRPERQLWYQANRPELAEGLSAKTFHKFLYGDMIEQLLIFFAKETGHKVEAEQLELEVDGVKGHIDCVIDGVTVDVKSASPYSFQKFKNGTVFTDDPFGYIGQISIYASQVSPNEGAAFLVADKVHGDIGVVRVDPETVAQWEPAKRIEHLKKTLASPDEPPRCYAAVPEGKSGNMKLGINCSYCPFKEYCWRDANGGKGLRKFLYYNGPVWLAHVEREPNVQEITD
jgi:hypothetical protein